MRQKTVKDIYSHDTSKPLVVT